MMTSSNKMTAGAPIPVTILTGFLGAGKTSAIRALLQCEAVPRIAVLVNEFGALGIDGDILRQCGNTACADPDILELSNGCICCTVADDFVPVMQRLLDRDTPPERIIIETSGLALPHPLIKAFGWPGIRSRAAIDGVITLIDATALTCIKNGDGHDILTINIATDRMDDDLWRQHDDPVTELFKAQLTAADIIVLNKIDLVDAPTIKAHISALKQHSEQTRSNNPPILTATEGRIDPAVLLGTVASDYDDMPPSEAVEDDHDHDDFIAFHLRLPDYASPEALEERLRAAMSRHRLFRIKGFAAIRGKAARLTVQSVGNRLNCHYSAPWHAEEPRHTDLIFIGAANLDRAGLEYLMGG